MLFISSRPQCVEESLVIRTSNHVLVTMSLDPPMADTTTGTAAVERTAKNNSLVTMQGWLFNNFSVKRGDDWKWQTSDFKSIDLSFICRMVSKMPDQISFLRKLLIAHFAMIWFFSSMDARMFD